MSIFTSPMSRHKEQEEGISKYEDQILSLELDAVTLMEDMGASSLSSYI